MSIIIPDTEDIEKLQKRFSEALGDEYQGKYSVNAVLCA